MFDWIKNINKEFPEFWKNYLLKFEEKSSRYVVINIDTTGMNPVKDVILSIAAIAVVDNNIIIGDSFEIVLLQYKYLHDNELSNEFIIESKQAKLPEPEALKAFINFIGNSVLVGHRIYFDVEIINEALAKLDCGRLKNEALDIEIMHRKLLDITDKPFSIEDMANAYHLPKSDYSSAAENAYTIALLFLKLKARLRL